MNTMQAPSERPDERGTTDYPSHTMHAPQAAIPPMGSLARDPRSKSPALAALLSSMPGLGQVYVGYYQRGFVHIIVVASIIALLASGQLSALIPLLGLFLAFFWLYNMIDAARHAALYNETLAGRAAVEPPQDFRMPGLQGSLLGGAILIAIGFILLLNTRFGVSLAWVEDWWPVAPMLVGAYLLVRAIQERRASDSSE
jgi:hypothetical protein